MIRLSVILPVFNGEKFILYALESFFSQANSFVQLIVIDDGSTDNTYKLIKTNYNSQILSGTLKLLTQNNEGVSSARNKGLSFADGDYITFLDSDDVLLDEYISEIVNAINLHEPDVVEFGFKMFKNKADLLNGKVNFVYEKFGLIDFYKVRDTVYAKSIWYPCIRAFKRSLFLGRSFPVGIRFCEDLMLLTEIYQDVDVVFHIEKALYGYRLNPDGATINVRPDYSENLIKFYNQLPKEKKLHLDYLKINLSYIIYRCNIGSSLPLNLRLDFFRLFLRYFFDRNISFRKKVILGFPSTHRFLKRVFKP